MDPITRAKFALVALVVITVAFCALAFVVDQAVMQLLGRRDEARARYRKKTDGEPE